jgi:hypothetical protein
VGPLGDSSLLAKLVVEHSISGLVIGPALGGMGQWLWGMLGLVIESGYRRACDRACL